MTPPVDLADLDQWAREVPYAEFARRRREAPVAWSPEEAPNSGFWSVTRYADILAASRDVATFSSARGVSFEEPTDADMVARRTIIDTDPPGHTKLRKIMSGSFTQRAVAVYEHFVAGLTEEVLDGGLRAGELDFVDAVAKEVPIRVLARIMGLPDADLDQFIDLGDRLIANTDPDITDVVWGRDDTDAYRNYPFRSPYGKQLWDLGREVVARKLDARDRGEHARRPAGHAAARRGRRRPAQRDRPGQLLLDPGRGGQRDDPDRHRPGRPGLLRASGAVGPAARRPGAARPGHRGGAAVELPDALHAAHRGVDTELGGAAIRAGDKVILWYVSGNRDEAEFDDPGVFDIGRTPNRHLSFGRGGPHLCLGVHLARLEVRVVLAALARRVARFELAGPPRRIRSNFTNGLKALPVRVELAR